MYKQKNESVSCQSGCSSLWAPLEEHLSKAGLRLESSSLNIESMRITLLQAEQKGSSGHKGTLGSAKQINCTVR